MDEHFLQKYCEWFWTESFWLPVGYKWKDLESSEFKKKPDVKDLWIIPVLVVVITIGRFFFERYVAKPFCKFIGIVEEKKKFTENEILEKFYKRVSKFPTNDQLTLLSNETQIAKSKIYTWYQKRRKYNQNGLMKKSTETCYRAVFYALLFSLGCYVLLKSDWFYDNSKWVSNYIEEHEFTSDLKLYYDLEISFYFALLFSQFFDTKRKDFYQMLVHHIATLILLLGSYITSLYRIGAVILFIHDAADVWLEAAKLANYAKISKVCDILFGVFAAIYVPTRLIFYPIWVSDGYFTYNNHTNSIFQNTLVVICYLILFLNVYWGYLIIRMVFRVIVVGKVAKDSRSDTEDEKSN